MRRIFPRRKNAESFDFGIGVVYYANTVTYNGSVFEFYGRRRRLRAGTGVTHGRSLLALYGDSCVNRGCL